MELKTDNLLINEVELSNELLKNIKTFNNDDLEKNKNNIKLGSFEHTFVKNKLF